MSTADPVLACGAVAACEPTHRLRIALVSYEFAGTRTSGGIGTYMRMLARMLALRGHDVEVFCHGAGAEGFPVSAPFRINSVDVARRAFPETIVPVFAARHGARPFDVIEAADYLAESAGVARAYPEVPRVVKLHTPASLIEHVINPRRLPLRPRLRRLGERLLRGQIGNPYWPHDRAKDLERADVMSAQAITAPSSAMAQALKPFWGLAPASVSVVPNVFIPDERLLAADPETMTGRVLYVGRLELRKGVLDLAAAIPAVVRAFPKVRFSFLGGSVCHPLTGEGLEAMVRRRLGQCADRVTFLGAASYEDLPRHYAEHDICVFPSVWENFPNTCLEAMAAARGIVASRGGGMAEMIEHGRSGLLAPPQHPAALARALSALLADPRRRMAMGRAARDRVLAAYGPQTIGPLQEASYARAMARGGVRL